MKAFKSILEFQEHFHDDTTCRTFLEKMRWGDTPCCVKCGSVNVTRLKDGKYFQCNKKGCRKQFSATIGTIYEKTKIPLIKWFLATYILVNHSKGISSVQLASWLDITQKTAWFLNHRIREVMSDKILNSAAPHTNITDGVWNNLQKQIIGIHHDVSQKHLNLYCKEADFKQRNKSLTQNERFAVAIKQSNGRLEYKKLIGK